MTFMGFKNVFDVNPNTIKYKSFDEGYEAFELKIPIWDNPYPPVDDTDLVGRTKREFWIRGWCEAMYRSEHFNG